MIKRIFKIEIAFYIIAGIVILMSAFVFIKYFNRKSAYVDVTVKITPEKWYWGEPSVPDRFVLPIEKGKLGFDNLGRKTAEVTNVEFFNTGGTTKLINVKLKLLTNYVQTTKQYMFQNQPLEINAPIEIHLTDTYIQGVITQINNSPVLNKYKNIIVTLILYDVYPWYADAIKIGDKFSSSENIEAEILNKDVTLAKKVNLVYGMLPSFTVLPIVFDPLKRDITVRTKIKVLHQNEKDLIFRTDQLIKIGNQISIPLDNGINLFSAYIIKVEEDVSNLSNP